MKHLFIPLELAIIAKDKGFNEKGLGIYTTEFFLGVKKGNLYFTSPLDDFEEDGRKMINAPLYQQIIDWLREKHAIVIYTTYFNNSMGEWWDWRIAYTGKYGTETKYYDALNSALKVAFSLIKPILTTEA